MRAEKQYQVVMVSRTYPLIDTMVDITLYDTTGHCEFTVKGVDMQTAKGYSREKYVRAALAKHVQSMR